MDVRALLGDLIRRCQHHGTWKMVEGIKRKIKLIVLKCDEDLWKASCMLYRSLGLYHKEVRYKRLNIWWRFVAKTPELFRSASCVVSLMCGTQPNGYGANFGSKKRCQLCDDFAVETIEHTVFSCNALRDIRDRLLCDLMDSMPVAMKISFCELSCKSKLDFIISGLGSETYVPEWQGVYANACSFIHGLYRERAAMYKRLDEIVS